MFFFLFLWFVSSKGLGCSFKVFCNVCKFWIIVFYNNSSIETLPFYDCIGSAYGEASWLCMFLEPRKEKAIAISLSSITGITDIEKDILPFCKELINNSKYRFLYFRIMGGTHAVYFVYNKLIRFASSKWCVFFK